MEEGKFNGGERVREDVKLEKEVVINKFAESKFLSEIFYRSNSYYILTNDSCDIVYKPKPT